MCIRDRIKKVINKKTPIIISIFSGRIADSGVDPEPIIIEAKKTFAERFLKIRWDQHYNSLPFNDSALALYKWAPIADELKKLDRKIVLNSVILKWDIVKKEFKERVKF